MAYVAVGSNDARDLRAWAIADAQARCGFSSKFEVWDEFYVRNAGSGSRWAAALLGGSSSQTLVTSGAGERGGGLQLSTGATAGSQCQLLSVPNGLGIFGGQVMDDLVASTSKWYCLHSFRLVTTPDAATTIAMGWVSSAGTPGPSLGVRGANSTTLLRSFLYGSATGVNSSVSADTSWHVGRMFNNGTSSPACAYDNEAVKYFTPAWGANAAPYIIVENGATAAAQTIVMGASIYIYESKAP